MKNILYIGNFLGNHTGYYSGPNKWIVNKLLEKGFKVSFASSKLNKLARFVDIGKLIIVNAKNTDLVLIDTYSTQSFYFAFFASLLCFVFRVRYVLLLHGGDLPRRFATSPRLVKPMFKHAFKVVSPSPYLQVASKNAGLPTPIVIPNPIDLSKYSFTQRQLLKPKLLWVRSLQEIYNPYMAIEVVQLLKQKRPNVMLQMVGPDKGGILGDLKNEVLVRGLDDYINFTGKLSLEEWTKLSIHSDIFINTTHIDNTPVSVLEAMALGLPVISTNVGGIPYIIANEEIGLLCSDSNVIEMCEAIDRLITDPELARRLACNARKYVEEYYSADKVFKQWLELISELDYC